MRGNRKNRKQKQNEAKGSSDEMQVQLMGEIRKGLRMASLIWNCPAGRVLCGIYWDNEESSMENAQKWSMEEN